MITFDNVKAFAKNSLKDAQREFGKNPTSQNWDAVLRAMLVYQQLRYVKNEKALIEKLASLTLGEWPECIVRWVLGISISQALNPI